MCGAASRMSPPAGRGSSIRPTSSTALDGTAAGQAQQALSLNREDLARAALARRAGIGRQLADIVVQRDSLLAQEPA